jgi:uncharacterized protein YndB with AHSA1/START domain
MRRVTIHTSIDHPVEHVFAYLADPTRWHDFAPAVAFRRQVDDEPPRVGSRWMATDRIGPFRVHFIDQLAELVPNERVVWLSSAPWNARVEYSCSRDGDATRILATYEGDISGRLRLLVGWLPSWATHWILAQDFRRLDRRLARETRALRRWQRHHV